MNSIEQLVKLKKLLDSGIIDETEFQKLKSEILNSINKGGGKEIKVEKIQESINPEPVEETNKKSKTFRNVAIGLLLFTIISILGYYFFIKSENKANTNYPTNTTTLATTEKIKSREVYWTGTISGKIPVFIHYQIDSSLIIGEITYLNTKNKLPIKLLGTIEDDKSYRLLEFEENGNINGIIRGIPSDENFNGTWFSTKKKNERIINLIKKDTVINTEIIEPLVKEIFGYYHYQYSDEGSRGEFNIIELPNSKASIELGSVTSAPSRNIAEIGKDTITISSTQFIYTIPNTEDCKIQSKFYKDFVYVRYKDGFCDGNFGLNARIDGIYLKKK